MYYIAGLFFSQLTKRYASDPRTLSSLIPALPLPEAEKAQECLGVITEIFQSIADEAAEKELVAARTKPSMFSFRSAPKALPKADVAPSIPAMMPAASTAKSAVAGADGDAASAPAEVVIPTNVVSSLAADAAQAQGSTSLPAGEASPPMELKEGGYLSLVTPEVKCVSNNMSPSLLGESVAVVDPVLGQTAEGEAAGTHYTAALYLFSLVFSASCCFAKLMRTTLHLYDSFSGRVGPGQGATQRRPDARLSRRGLQVLVRCMYLLQYPCFHRDA